MRTTLIGFDVTVGKRQIRADADINRQQEVEVCGQNVVGTTISVACHPGNGSVCVCVRLCGPYGGMEMK